MRHLLACTCLTPLSIALLATPAVAETTITTRVTTPLATATAANGQPDSIRIGSAGTVAPTGGVAVTLSSNHAVVNEGAIEIRDAANATGILVTGARAANLTNSGRITVDENYTPADNDKDGDLDGPLAQGTARFGVRIAADASLTGNVANSGPITIEGNNSAGIALDGRLTGNVTSSGAISVVGNDSFGVRVADVTGAVRLTGTIDARGANAVGVAIDGAVGGALSVQGSIVASGYRSTTRPSDPSKLDADDLLQGGPALRVANNVGGGIAFEAPAAGASGTTAQLLSYGAAPALLIGSAERNVTIGAIGNQANGHGLVNAGTITADGVYANTAATAVQIGGLGRAVTIAGGLTNSNRIAATSFGADATGLRIGAEASMPEIRNSGTILAEGSGAGTTRARAVQIDQNATATTIRNNGAIEAKATAAAGNATAIHDASGRLTLIENGGRVDATGADPVRAIAIDARANTNGVTVRQSVASGTNPPTPRITGQLLFGNGADTFEASAGTIAGNAAFAGGNNRLTLSNAAAFTGNVAFGAGADRVSLGGTSTLTGDLDFGGGADSIELAGTARYRGRLSNAGAAAVSVAGGRFELSNNGVVALGSLSVAQGGALGVSIDAATGQSTLLTVAGTASFAQGSELTVRVTDIGTAEGRFTVLRAGQLTGAPTLSVANSTLPFFFKGALASGTPANELAVQIQRKSATELGLNSAQAAAWDPVYRALLTDKDVGNAFLSFTNQASFMSGLGSLLPDHGGGVFETATTGSRATARFLTDPRAPLVDMGRWGYWLQQVGWGRNKAQGQSEAYDLVGWGVAGGTELITPTAGSFGLSLAYLNSDVKNADNANRVDVSHYELGAYWRARFGGLNAWARASAGWLNMDGSRIFAGAAAGKPVRRSTVSSRDGQLWSAAGGATYELQLGRVLLRPALSVDWYRLSEDGYAESGGGGLNLIVGKRVSDELAGTASATLGYTFGQLDAGWFRIEAEGGRRQILAGGLGDTVVRFANDPKSFRLPGDARTDGWLGRLRLLGGNPGFTVAGEASAEEQQGRAALALRVSVQMGM